MDTFIFNQIRPSKLKINMNSAKVNGVGGKDETKEEAMDQDSGAAEESKPKAEAAAKPKAEEEAATAEACWMFPVLYTTLCVCSTPLYCIFRIPSKFFGSQFLDGSRSLVFLKKITIKINIKKDTRF